MSTQESAPNQEDELLQTWKHARTSKQIGKFLMGRLKAIEAQSKVDDQDFDDIEALAA